MKMRGDMICLSVLHDIRDGKFNCSWCSKEKPIKDLKLIRFIFNGKLNQWARPMCKQCRKDKKGQYAYARKKFDPDTYEYGTL